MMINFFVILFGLINEIFFDIIKSSLHGVFMSITSGYVDILNGILILFQILI
jgi:ABC-type amino acid transport system permease subunit